MSKYSPMIQIRKIKDVNLDGGVVFDGFQSIGLTSTIACGCFINSLKTELVGVLDSPIFPPISVVYNSKPYFPARIYANEEKKLSFFVSEINLEVSSYRPIANAILTWAKENDCKTIISIAGKPTEKNDETKDETKVYAISNSKEYMKKLEESGIQPVVNGSIRGIPGILLNESTWRKINVIVFIADVIAGVPDFRAAATVSQAVSRIIPGAHCDIKQLIKEAEVVEHNLRDIKNQSNNKIEDRIYR